MSKIKECSLNESNEMELKRYIEKKGAIFLSTPFSRKAVDRLIKFKVKAFKIGSGECNNYPLIEHIASFGKPMIISTGMNDIDCVKKTVAILENKGVEYALLHCTNIYPTPPNLVRLDCIRQLKKAYPSCLVGLSDHTLGIECPVVAIALGATVIEKHFILDKSIGGPDAHFSLDEKEFTEMVSAVRKAEQMIGKVDYEMTDKKKKSRQFSRSLFIVKDVKSGDKISNENVRSIRPGFGMHPRHLSEIIGKKFKQDFEKGTPMNFDLIN